MSFSFPIPRGSMAPRLQVWQGDPGHRGDGGGQTDADGGICQPLRGEAAVDFLRRTTR